MVQFHATINQAPMGKGRARAVNAGKHARVYTPTATANWEHFAAGELRTAWVAFISAYHDEPAAPAEGPLGLEIVAVFPRTADLLKVGKRTGMHKHPTHRLPYSQKPDADNIAKSACDALQKAGVVLDDKLIAVLTIGKHYAAIGEPPHVEIRLWSLT